MADYGHHTFPLLKYEEILQCLEELRISFTMEDLKNPNPIHIQKVYESFVDLLTGNPRDEFDNSNQIVLDSLDTPDLHVGALSELAFFRMVLRFMQVVGIHDFNMKDFLKPTPERVRRILSAVINFAKFREEQLSEFEKYTTETDQLTEKKQILEVENQALAEKLHTARLQRVEEEPVIQKLEAEISSLTTEVNQLNKEQNVMQKDFATVKSTATDLTNKLTNQTDTLNELRQGCTKLSSQIVESPEKLKQNLLDLEAAVTAENEAVLTLEKNSRDLQLKIDSFSQVDLDIDKSMSLMEESEVEMKKLQESQQRVSVTQDSLSKKTIEYKDLCLKEQNLKKQIQSSLEKITRLQKSQEAKREGATKKLETLQKSHVVLSSERATLYAQIEEISVQIRIMEQKIGEVKGQSEAEMQQIRADFARLNSQVKHYHSNLIQSLATA